MRNILIINTGGTYNKHYNPIDGTLVIDATSHALKIITHKWQNPIEYISVVNKDSLDMDDDDRADILQSINSLPYSDVIIIHGTDTMEMTACYLEQHVKNKRILLTGSMTPFAFDPIEAVANLCSGYGFLQSSPANGIYISMHGIVDLHHKVTKNRTLGKFEYR